MEAESGIRCPRCGSDAWYHFGKTSTGKQRYVCQVCARQFIVDDSYKSIINNRPLCPECGEFMHVYMRDLIKTTVRLIQNTEKPPYRKFQEEKTMASRIVFIGSTAIRSQTRRTHQQPTR